jgi:hypothetical protein
MPEGLKKYDESHNGPFDRGAADAYYSGFPYPHKWVPTGEGKALKEVILTDPAELEAYYAGFASVSPMDRKKWD